MMTSPALDALPPLPFEDEGNYPVFRERLWATLKLFFTQPLQVFERIGRGKETHGPWLFSVTLLWPLTTLFSVIWRLADKPLAAHGLVKMDAGAGRYGLVFFCVMLAVFPGLLWLGIVLGGAFHHGCLWLWRGLACGFPMEHTIRVTGYATAISSLLVVWLPQGLTLRHLSLISTLVLSVYLGLALAKAHCTEAWRGIAAVLTPYAVLKGLAIGFMYLKTGQLKLI